MEEGSSNHSPSPPGIPVSATTADTCTPTKKPSSRMQVTPVNPSEEEESLFRSATPPPPSASLPPLHIRPVRSHPNMNAVSAAAIPINNSSNSSLVTRKSPGHHASGGSLKGSLTNIPTARSEANSRDASLHSSSTCSRGALASTGAEIMRQRSSPGAGEEKHSLGAGPEDENEEEGGHDTITSLAGVKMLQKYRKALSGSRSASNSSLNQNNRLENLFKDEHLEDIKESDDEEKQSLVGKQPPITSSAEEEEEEGDDIFVPPDGGYGWMVALGAFICLFWCAGVIKSYGVIFNSILTTFSNTSVSLASWIPASMTSFALAMAPFASALCQKYNCRYVTMMGSLICALGLVLSSQVPNMESLFVTLGVLTGIGIGLCTTPGIILTARYFDKNRAKANAFCLSGTAAGSFTLPFLIEALLSAYGFRGTVLVLGACMLHICISAALFRPLAVHVKVVKNAKAQKAARAIQDAATAAADAATAAADAATAAAAAPASAPVPNNEALKEDLKQINLKYPRQHRLLSQTNSDPREMAANLNSRLFSLRSVSSPDGADSVFENGASIHSSRSSVINPNDSASNRHFQLHHNHHHHHLNSCGGSTMSSTMKNPFGSIPMSLPAHFSCPGSSNGSWTNSRDNLHWADEVAALDVPDIDIEGNCPLRELQYPYQGASSQNYSSDPHLIQPNTDPYVRPAKALSLRELYMHQIGSRLNIYKSLLLGTDQDALSTSRSFIGSKNASVVSLQSWRAKGESKPEDLRQSKKKKSRSNPSSKRRRNFRTSLMFSIEDLATDSTSILKDHRYPSVSSENCPAGNTKRIVNLDRSVSCNSPRRVLEERRRKRCASEGPGSGDNDNSGDVKNSRFTLVPAAKSVTNPAGNRSKLEPPSENTRKQSLLSNKQLEVDETAPDKEEVISVRVGPWKRAVRFVNKYIDLSLTKDPMFVLITASVMTMTFGVPHMLFFLPSYAATANADASLILSICSVFDLLGRLVSGFILDMRLVPYHILYASVILMSGVSVILVPFTNDMVSLCALVSCYSVGTGTWFLMIPLLLSEHLGVDKIGSSYGLVRFFQAGANLFGPIVAGYLWEVTGDLAPAFFYMGCVMCLGAVFALLQPVVAARQQGGGAEKDSSSAEEEEAGTEKGSEIVKQKSPETKTRI